MHPPILFRNENYLLKTSTNAVVLKVCSADPKGFANSYREILDWSYRPIFLIMFNTTVFIDVTVQYNTVRDYASDSNIHNIYNYGCNYEKVHAVYKYYCICMNSGL